MPCKPCISEDIKAVLKEKFPDLDLKSIPICETKGTIELCGKKKGGGGGSRVEYNTCVAGRLKGKQLSKEERAKEFCIAAKTCSKKMNEQQATEYCGKPRLSKEMKKLVPEETEELTCDKRKQRIMDNIDRVNTMVKEGEAEKGKELIAQVMNDSIECVPDEATITLLKDTVKEFNDIAKRHYLKGEGRDVAEKLKAAKELIGAS